MSRMLIPDTTAFSPIVKYDKQDDGSLLVYGKATDSSLDSDEQVCDSEWLKSAMPAWFKFGNIREQHSNIAAGVATEYAEKDGAHYITAHIIDPNSVRKVENKVLKGFSIGIRKPRVVRDNKAVGGRIVDGDIVEVSLVDRPANPSCVLQMAKADGGELEQVEVFTKGADMEEVEMVEAVEVEKSDAIPTVADIIAKANEINGDLVKFNAAEFKAARDALANLIAIEAMEMKDGHDELASLQMLLNAVWNLMCWYEQEEEEGEVTPMEEAALEAEPVVETANLEDVTLAAGADIVKSEEVIVDEESIDDDMDKNAIKSMVTDLVTSLLTKHEGEDKTDTAAEERIKSLEAELEQVKSLAVSGGPSRVSAASVKSAEDEVTVRANLLLAKAGNTTDQKLADGYRLLANDLLKSVRSN